MEMGLTSLLRLAWAAGTLPIILAFLPVPGAGVLWRLLSGFAARGKTMPSTSRRFTCPQRFFLHFYVVAVVLTTCLLISTWFYAYVKMVPLAAGALHYSTAASRLTGGAHMFSFHKSQLTPAKHKHLIWRTVLVLLLMEAQVVRRLYETLSVFSYSSSARMHIFGYLTGLFFYAAAPLSLSNACAPEVLSYVGGQIAAFIVKGRGQMPDLEFDWWDFLKPLFKLGLCQWIGTAIYAWGWFHQLRCHAILGSLREHKGDDGYVIPHGDWFQYVSCPHYFAEIIIYTGILVASGLSDVSAWLLFTFVVANLVFAAAETHSWYRHKYEDYPPSRRAIIPFIY